MLLLGIGLFKGRKSYWIILAIDFLLTLWLFANILYYREFSNFLSFSIIKTSGSTSDNLGKSIAGITLASDFLVFIDIAAIIVLLITKVIKIDVRPLKLKVNLLVELLALSLMGLNLLMAQKDRSGLLTRTFDNNYIVKYLGINEYAIYDGYKTAQTNAQMAKANVSDLRSVREYLKSNYVKPNPAYNGVAKGKNVLVIHLESFQQFLINLKVNGKEVTPFLNSLYRNKHTLSFDNFYNQVGLGRTSDAENMLETSTYGISDGSLFTSLGSENTFQAAPQILRQDGYTSAVFHGNVGTFWNRNDVYKNMGYNYFFDKNYYSSQTKDSSGYGLKDKLLFAESIKYLEQMQQPFYAKFITVTNHIPFELDKEDRDPNFQTTKTRDQTINNYFETAHYLDEAVHEFFNYLKASGLYKNSMIVIYGDHYGLSNSENETLAPIINESANTWNTYNNVQMQRVPFMIHANNLKGKISHEIAGEIDVLPTLLHLLGINNKGYVQFGNDMLSPHRQNWIVLRNGTIISSKYIIVGDKGIKGTVYNRINGRQIINFSPQEKKEITTLAKKAKDSLHYSDLLNNHNLLRFYTPAGFVPVDPTQFNYSDNYQKMIAIRQDLADSSTSLYSRNHNRSTTKLYKTDASELHNREKDITKVPEGVLKNQLIDQDDKDKNSKK